MSEDGKYIWDGNSWTAISDIKDSKAQNHPTPGLPLTMSPGMPLPMANHPTPGLPLSMSTGMPLPEKQ